MGAGGLSAKCQSRRLSALPFLSTCSRTAFIVAVQHCLGRRIPLQYHHLYADDAGESHWLNVEVVLKERTFAPPAQGILVSEPESVTSMMFLKLPAGWNEPIHPTPKKQALICLAGVVRVTASDAEAREIGPGDVWLMEDLIGKGHHTRVTSDEDFKALIVQYD